MNKKKNVSNLSEHKIHKKKGIVRTPLNDSLGDKLLLNSWPKERMPEYIWLGLILMYYGRNEGFKRVGEIFSGISQKIKNLYSPKLSIIFNLTDEDQHSIFKIITNKIDNSVLSPLTVLYRSSSYPIFNKYFNVSQIRFEDRIEKLSKAIKIYYPSQGNEATDLRYLAVIRYFSSGKIKIANHLNNSIEALKEYPYTDHEDEKMKRYRPMVRSMESNDFDEKNTDFVNKFWRDIGMVTKCTPMGIAFHKNENLYRVFISNFQKVIKYILNSNKEKNLSEDKFDVIIGSVNYALKIFIEINEKSLGNTILGRHGIRTIAEILIIIKYLLKRESDNPEIWKQYKLYGISKYKLVLLKSRETQMDKTAHFIPPIADILVNEIKWEEFIDIDLKYFDKQGIREKSIEVQEKDLYDLFYDYDSSFVHGLWGAVRESSMLNCDNPNHQYHSIPDVYSDQLLPDVKADSFKIMKRLFLVMTEIYDVPEVLSKDIGDEG